MISIPRTVLTGSAAALAATALIAPPAYGQDAGGGGGSAADLASGSSGLLESGILGALGSDLGDLDDPDSGAGGSLAGFSAEGGGSLGSTTGEDGALAGSLGDDGGSAGSLAEGSLTGSGGADGSLAGAGSGEGGASGSTPDDEAEVCELPGLGGSVAKFYPLFGGDEVPTGVMDFVTTTLDSFPNLLDVVVGAGNGAALLGQTGSLTEGLCTTIFGGEMVQPPVTEVVDEDSAPAATTTNTGAPSEQSDRTDSAPTSDGVAAAEGSAPDGESATSTEQSTSAGAGDAGSSVAGLSTDGLVPTSVPTSESAGETGAGPQG